MYTHLTNCSYEKNFSCLFTLPFSYKLKEVAKWQILTCPTHLSTTLIDSCTAYSSLSAYMIALPQPVCLLQFLPHWQHCSVQNSWLTVFSYIITFSLWVAGCHLWLISVWNWYFCMKKQRETSKTRVKVPQLTSHRLCLYITILVQILLVTF